MNRVLCFVFLGLAGCTATHDADGGSSRDAPLVYDCDPRHAACDALPPTCPPGYAAAVSGGCWDACVMNVECGPIACDPSAAGQCPTGWGCVTDPSGRCAPPR